jgi:hypothetical protein
MPLTTLCNRLIVTGIRADHSTLELGAFALPISAMSVVPRFRHACAEGKHNTIYGDVELPLPVHRPRVASQYGAGYAS